MDNKQYIKQTINIEKAKEKNRKQLNLIENINSLYKDKYKQEIQNELNNYEKFIFQSLNNITNINNNLEQILMNKNLIQNEKNKPVFKYNCESCLACANNCPQNAIQLKIQKSK